MKTTRTVSTAGEAIAARESPRVEKPPVDNVLIARQTDSKTPTPARNRLRAQADVSARYIHQIACRDCAS